MRGERVALVHAERASAITHGGAGIEGAGIVIVDALFADLRVDLGIVSTAANHQAVSIAGLEHGEAGTELIHLLDHHTLESGRTGRSTVPGGLGAPVGVVAGQDDFLTLGPVVQLEGAGAIGDAR